MSLVELLGGIANWPEKSGKRIKIVQLVIDNEFYLRFDTQFSGASHDAILEQTLKLCGFSYESVLTKTGSDFLVPSPIGDRYVVLGAGQVNLNLEKKEVVFFGGSFSYDMGISKEHIIKLRSLFKEWLFEDENERLERMYSNKR